MGNKTIFLTPEAEQIWDAEFDEKDKNFSKWVQDCLLDIEREKEGLTIEEVEKNIKALQLDSQKLDNEIEFWGEKKVNILATKKMAEKKVEEEIEEVRQSLMKYWDIPEDKALEIAEDWVNSDKKKNYHTIAEELGYKDRLFNKLEGELNPAEAGDASNIQNGETDDKGRS